MCGGVTANERQQNDTSVCACQKEFYFNLCIYLFDVMSKDFDGQVEREKETNHRWMNRLTVKTGLGLSENLWSGMHESSHIKTPSFPWPKINNKLIETLSSPKKKKKNIFWIL